MESREVLSLRDSVGHVRWLPLAFLCRENLSNSLSTSLGSSCAARRSVRGLRRLNYIRIGDEELKRAPRCATGWPQTRHSASPRPSDTLRVLETIRGG